MHLKESHITFHTYVEDIYDNFAIVRLEYHISSCSEANVYNALREIILIDDKDYSFPDLISIDYIRRGAKFEDDSSKIIYDPYLHNFDSYMMYEISSNIPTLNTSQHTLLLDTDLMLKKFQLDNNFFSIDCIIKLKNFLLSSYSDHAEDLKVFEIKSSK